MSLQRIVVVVITLTGLGAAIGALVGLLLGVLAPELYLSMFAVENPPQFGVGIGVANGVIFGFILGIIGVICVSFGRRSGPPDSGGL